MEVLTRRPKQTVGAAVQGELLLHVGELTLQRLGKIYSHECSYRLQKPPGMLVMK